MKTNAPRISVLAALIAATLALSGCQPNAPAGNEQAAPSAPANEQTTAVESADSVAEAPPATAQPVPTPTPGAAPAPVTAPVAAAPRPTPARPASSEQYAQVVSVTPVKQSIDNPQQVCRDVEVVHATPPKDEHRVAGAVIGAVVGGALGNQVGDGKGRDAARIAGAIGGAVAGRKIQEQQQTKNTETRIETQCETINDARYEVIGYDIVYSYAGQTHTARVAEDPGERIKLPVRSIEQ